MDKIITRAESQLSGAEHPVVEGSRDLEDESASQPLKELSGNLTEGLNQVRSAEESTGDLAKDPKAEPTREKPVGVLYECSAGRSARTPPRDPNYIRTFLQFPADCVGNSTKGTQRNRHFALTE